MTPNELADWLETHAEDIEQRARRAYPDDATLRMAHHLGGVGALVEYAGQKLREMGGE